MNCIEVYVVNVSKSFSMRILATYIVILSLDVKFK